MDSNDFITQLLKISEKELEQKYNGCSDFKIIEQRFNKIKFTYQTEKQGRKTDEIVLNSHV